MAYKMPSVYCTIFPMIAVGTGEYIKSEYYIASSELYVSPEHNWLCMYNINDVNFFKHYPAEPLNTQRSQGNLRLYEVASSINF